MPLVILHHLLNVSVQLANKRGLKKILPLEASTAFAVDFVETTNRSIKELSYYRNELFTAL
jgi:hypothetical protein